MRRLVVILCLFLLAIEASSHARASRPPGWNDATRGRDAVPDYDRVFAADRVNRLDIFLTSTGANWPLIRFLLDDPVFRAAYRTHVEELITTVFDAGRLTARLRSEQTLIAPYVIGPEGEQSGRTFLSSPGQFGTAVAGLVTFVESRSAEVKQILGTTR